MFCKTAALILREVRFRESDRMLTVLTAENGKLSVAAHGALSRKSRMAAATQQLTYAELTLFEKNGRLTVREAVTKEGFPGLRMEIERLALASYFAECLEQFAGEDQPEPELMQLGLNCLYALSENLADRDRIKAAFELRLTAIEGYAPVESQCAVCGREEIRDPVFQAHAGGVVCRECRKAGEYLPLGEAALAAMRHILLAPPKRLLAFQMEETDRKRLSQIAEHWLLCCAERGFSTLEYYKKL